MTTVHDGSQNPSSSNPSQAPAVPLDPIRIKNRRRQYLERHPSYFADPDLELADPLLYDRLVRRFQTVEERDKERQAKGYSGVLEADLERAEAKRAAVTSPKGTGEDEEVTTKEEAWERWRWEMEMRFVRGEDEEFDYAAVDGEGGSDAGGLEEREEEERWFDEEAPAWTEGHEGERTLPGETGIQDF